MAQYISKGAVVAEIKNWKQHTLKCGYAGQGEYEEGNKQGRLDTCEKILSFLDTLEVIDPYAQCIQYASIESGIKAHAEDYSFNIESELFNQLTKEQQVLWRKEIEQACISGGYDGVELARDPRYKENLEVKEVDLEKELDSMITPELKFHKALPSLFDVAKHFFEFGLKIQKGE